MQKEWQDILLPFRSKHAIGKKRMVMYEAFFGMKHTPFVRDISTEKIYESDVFWETLGRPADVFGGNGRSRLWKIYPDPQILFRTSLGRIYHPVPF